MLMGAGAKMQFRKNDDLVSVIVPIYGEDEYLDQCIESIVNQTYQYLEIILVDDGSTDQCPLICDQWAKKDERIRVIHKKNGGLVSARKAGMDISTGAYIGYIDGDDWVDLDYYEKLVDVARKSKADAIITGYQKELHNKSIACYNHLDEGTYRKRELLDIVYPKMMFDEKTAQGTITTYVWNKLFRKENIYNAQMSVDNDIVIGEDAACIYPALLSCNVVVVSGMLGYHYRIRFNSILRTVEKERKRILQMQILQNCFKNILQRSPYRIMIYNQFCDYFFMQLIMQCHLVRLNSI